ncbi:MAG: hypothetical protein RIQ41_118 [Candidatus Parcubacteria bacterium]|jgi:hypothetical protein
METIKRYQTIISLLFVVIALAFTAWYYLAPRFLHTPTQPEDILSPLGITLGSSIVDVPMICDTNNLPGSAPAELLWNFACETASSSPYIGIYWKRPDLQKLSFQNRVINRFMRKAALDPQHPLTGKFVCTENKKLPDETQMKSVLAECINNITSSIATTTSYTAFIYSYPSEMTSLRGMPVIVVSGSSKEEVFRVASTIYRAIKPHTTTSTSLLNIFAEKAYADGEGDGPGPSDGAAAGIGDSASSSSSSSSSTGNGGDPSAGTDGSLGGGCHDTPEGCGGYVPPTCTNGATNYPSCNNICFNGYSNYPACGPVVIGYCGTAPNSCASGTLGANSIQPNGDYHWYCNGSNGGANSGLCFYEVPPESPTPAPTPAPSNQPQDGACGNTPNSCSGGILGVNNPQAGGGYHWYCDGVNGGVTSPLCWWWPSPGPTPAPDPVPSSCGAGEYWDGITCCTIGWVCYNAADAPSPSPSPSPSPAQAPATPPSQLILNITPRSIERGGLISLSWSIKDPNTSCKLTADVQKPAVCDATCQTAVASASTTLNSTLSSGTTNANDPYGGNRLMSTALQTAVTSVYARGTKSVILDYTTTFNLSCGTTTSPIKSIIYVTDSNEG